MPDDVAQETSQARLQRALADFRDAQRELKEQFPLPVERPKLTLIQGGRDYA